MHGLAGLLGKVLQRRQRLPSEVFLPHGGGPQGVEAQAERVAVGSGIAVEVPEGFERVQDAEHRGLALAEFVGEFGQTPAFPPRETIDHLQALVEGAEQVGVRGGAVWVPHAETRGWFLSLLDRML